MSVYLLVPILSAQEEAQDPGTDDAPLLSYPTPYACAFEVDNITHPYTTLKTLDLKRDSFVCYCTVQKGLAEPQRSPLMV